jgi:hypothetical protein
MEECIYYTQAGYGWCVSGYGCCVSGIGMLCGGISYPLGTSSTYVRLASHLCLKRWASMTKKTIQ